jgi:hypothetical protein
VAYWLLVLSSFAWARSSLDSSASSCQLWVAWVSSGASHVRVRKRPLNPPSPSSPATSAVSSTGGPPPDDGENPSGAAARSGTVPTMRMRTP